MKLKHAGVLAAAASAVLIAGPAFAAGPPYTVSVGGSSATATHPISATSTGTVKFSAKNSSGTIINMNCTSVTGSGNVYSGTGINPVADITSTTWSGCTIPGGAATVTQTGTWNVTGTGSNATSGSETIAGYVGNVVAGVKTTANPAICNFTVKGLGGTVNGKATGSFVEGSSPQQLVISETGYTGNLELTGVSGCLGQLQSGNKANFEATLNITSPDGAINLS